MKLSEKMVVSKSSKMINEPQIKQRAYSIKLDSVRNTGFCKRTKKSVSKKKVKLLLRIIGVLVSCVGFLYQTSQLLAIYLSGKTSVDNRVERLQYSEPPAITICVPTFMAMDRFADYVLKNSDLYSELYEEYMKFRQNIKEWNSKESAYQHRLHKKFVSDVFPNVNLSILEVFENISIQELNISRFDTMALTEKEELIELERPVAFQSLVPFSDPRKCFTYFNEFDPNFNSKKFNLIKLYMRFWHDNHTFPLEEYYRGDFHIAIHPANVLPQYIREESFKNLKMGHINVVSYSETRTRLLPLPYDTKCQDYELRDSADDMRSDCIQKCIDRQILVQHPELKCISTDSNFKLIRRDSLFELAHLSLCNYKHYDPGFNKQMIRERILRDNECDKKCPKNCRESFYDFTIDVIKAHSDVDSRNEFAITVQHNRIPDQIVIHKPVMSWIELMSNFGGLLGMWLGLSVAFVIEYFIKFIQV